MLLRREAWLDSARSRKACISLRPCSYRWNFRGNLIVLALYLPSRFEIRYRFYANFISANACKETHLCFLYSRRCWLSWSKVLSWKWSRLGRTFFFTLCSYSFKTYGIIILVLFWRGFQILSTSLLNNEIIRRDLTIASEFFFQKFSFPDISRESFKSIIYYAHRPRYLHVLKPEKGARRETGPFQIVLSLPFMKHFRENKDIRSFWRKKVARHQSGSLYGNIYLPCRWRRGGWTGRYKEGAIKRIATFRSADCWTLQDQFWVSWCILVHSLPSL